MEDGSESASLKGHTGAVVALAMAGAADRLATASKDGTFKLWDTVNGREIMTLHNGSLANTGIGQPAQLAFTQGDRALIAITQPAAAQPVILMTEQ